jgi:hypothetical protein
MLPGAPAIRFAHKLTKKQTRLQALQQLNEFFINSGSDPT